MVGVEKALAVVIQVVVMEVMAVLHILVVVDHLYQVQHQMLEHQPDHGAQAVGIILGIVG